MLQRYPDDVEFAEPDLGVFTIPELPSDASSSDHWGLDRMNLQRARHTGKGVHIYVMDTGTRVSHEDFGGRAIATIDTIAGGGNVVECEQSSDPLCGQDTHGHGTPSCRAQLHLWPPHTWCHQLTLQCVCRGRECLGHTRGRCSARTRRHCRHQQWYRLWRWHDHQNPRERRECQCPSRRCAHPCLCDGPAANSFYPNPSVRRRKRLKATLE